MQYVMLNPAGTQNIGLVVIVRAQTGVTYEQQCGGYATEQQRTEGFLIPVGSVTEAQKIYDWFWATFKGHCYKSERGTRWTQETITQLQSLVSEVFCWHSTGDGEDQPHQLQLDVERIDECIEAWIPVLTQYGPGILTLENSD
jgi:hypothetical protein